MVGVCRGEGQPGKNPFCGEPAPRLEKLKFNRLGENGSRLSLGTAVVLTWLVIPPDEEQR